MQSKRAPLQSFFPAPVVARRACTIRAIGFAFGFLVLSAPHTGAEEPIKWITSLSGGSQIEIPSFFADGKIEPIHVFAEGKKFQPRNYPDAELNQYQANSSSKPFDCIKALLVDGSADYDADYATDDEFRNPKDKVTYELNKPSLGAISGTYANGTIVFYGMCKKGHAANPTCFDMTWSKKDQAMFGPIAERIARSFSESQ